MMVQLPHSGIKQIEIY